MHIVANFKMSGNSKFYTDVNERANNLKLADTKLILCPPFVYLPFFNLNKNIYLGSQDISMNEKEQSTGEISAKMLKDFGVEYCLIGHSERSEAENVNIILNKINNALKHKITPIICVGESSSEQSLTIIKNRVNKYLKECVNSKVFIAYEPIWCIGSGNTPSLERINDVANLIRAQAEKLNVEVFVLYGGGVNLKNFKILKKVNIDGFLIGSFSKNIENFFSLLK